MRRFLPFWRLLLKTDLPSLVDILFKNPSARLLLIFDFRVIFFFIVSPFELRQDYITIGVLVKKKFLQTIRIFAIIHL